MAAALAALALVAGGAAFLLLRGDSETSATATIGPEGGTLKFKNLTVTVPVGAYRKPTRLRIAEGAGPSQLGAASKPRSPGFDIHADAQPARAVKLAFALPEAPSATIASRLAVASRAEGQRAWTLEVGRVRGRQYVVSAEHFSGRQLLELPRSIGRSARAKLSGFIEDIKQFAGIRGRPPNCPAPPEEWQLEVNGETKPDDPLLYACLDTADGKPLLRVNNNRAVALEFEVPAGMELKEVQGRSLNERLLDAVNHGLPGGKWRFVPGGGSVVLGGEPPEEPVEFEATNQALTLDFALFASTTAGGKALESAGKSLELVSCLYSASQARHFSPGELGDVLGECGKHFDAGASIALALFIEAAKKGAGFLDQFDRFLGHKVELSFKKVDPRSGPGTSCGTYETGKRWRGPYGDDPRPINVEIKIDEGQARCDELQETFRWYVKADNPCVDAGNTCPLERGQWTCSTPSAGSYPVLYRCSSGDGVIALARDAAGPSIRGSLRNCGSDADVEPPGPYEVRSNIGCRAGKSIANQAIGCEDACDDVQGFSCETRNTGYESAEATCRWGARVVRFSSGA